MQSATAGSPDGGPRTIVGVRVTTKGSDIGSLTPMLQQIEARTGQLPTTMLADGGHVHFECVRWASEHNVNVVMPLPPASKAPTSRRSAQDDAIVQWRAQMQTAEAKELYRARAGLAELPNARLKGRMGLGQLLVRNLPRVTSVALLGALAHNVLSHAAGLLV